MKLIDKSAVVAETKKLIRENELYLSENASDAVRLQKTGAYSVLNDLLHFLDTLEVKEVDLWTEYRNCIEHYRNRETGYTDFNIAGYFFELGLKAQKGDKL